MTKKILSLVAGLLLATAVYADQFNDAPKSELSISYGAVPAYPLVNDFCEAIAIGMLAPMADYMNIPDKNGWGVINVDYNYHVCPWLAIGVNGSFGNAQGDIKTKVVSNPEKIGTAKEQYYTAMVNFKFDWFRREHVSMYSRISAGATFAHSSEEVTYEGKTTSDSKNKTCFMGQVSPFGIEAGSNHVRAFAEVGFGQCGIAQIGCRFRF